MKCLFIAIQFNSISKHLFGKQIHYKITVYDIKYFDSQETSFKA